MVNDKRKQSLRGAIATCLRAIALRRASVAISEDCFILTSDFCHLSSIHYSLFIRKHTLWL